MAALLGVASLAASPRAAAQVFTDQASWEASAGLPRLVEDFEAAPLGSLSLGTTAVGTVDVEISGDSTNGSSIVQPGAVNQTRELAGAATQNPGNATTIRIVFPTPVTAFGADFASAITGGGLQVDTGIQIYDLASLGVNNGFFGVVEAPTFSSVAFTSPGFESFQVDDVRFVPAEPQVTIVQLVVDPPAAGNSCLFPETGSVAVIEARQPCGSSVICSSFVTLLPGGTPSSNAALIRSLLEPLCAPEGIAIGGAGNRITGTSMGLAFDVCVNGLNLNTGPLPICSVSGGVQQAELVAPVSPVPALSARSVALLAAALFAVALRSRLRRGP